MTGLEKIILHIESEAHAKADQRMNQAKAEVRLMLEENEEKIRRLQQQGQVALKKELEDYLERGRAAAALQERRLLLEMKQQLIGELIAKAQESLLHLGDSAYFEVILKMIEKYARQEPGEIVFSRKDLKRMPRGFQQKWMKPLRMKAATGGIEGGFILIYGDVEENYTFEALFSAHREALQDHVGELLFG